MKTIGLALVAGAVVLAASCVAHRSIQTDTTCVPLSVPLSVADGEVVISCSWNPEELASGPRPSLLDCAIRPKGTDRAGKTGHFSVPERHDEYRFDPTNPSAYDNWDGCYRIHLRDGRDLDEMTIITSKCGVEFKR